MAICYKPLKAWRDDEYNITFKETEGNGSNIELPCGQCMGCRLERSRQWAVRCVHEAKQHKENCFITLTYDPENLPEDESLKKRHLQLFWKRLRKRLAHKKIKYFACGEYGEHGGRPHYHAIIFGHDFRIKHNSNDVDIISKSDYGTLFSSTSLDKIWQKGITSVGEANFETAAYVARYCTKKVNGSLAEEHYNGKTPEFATMSRGNRLAKNNSIGHAWIENFYTDVYPSNEVIHQGRRMKVPAYYDKWLEKNNPELYEKVKIDRENSMVNKKEETKDRLYVKHKVALLRNKKHTRSLEGDITNNTFDEKLSNYNKGVMHETKHLRNQGSKSRSLSTTVPHENTRRSHKGFRK